MRPGPTPPVHSAESAAVLIYALGRANPYRLSRIQADAWYLEPADGPEPGAGCVIL